MKRSLKTGGGKDHIELVKLATKRIVDEFEDLMDIVINYEPTELRLQIKIDDHSGWESTSRMTEAHFDFRPDIVVRTSKQISPGQLEAFYQPRKILRTRYVVFEAETDPRNIFKNLIKIEGYKRIKANRFGSGLYSFVLVCWKDAEVPQDIEPFDEIWKFERILK